MTSRRARIASKPSRSNFTYLPLVLVTALFVTALGTVLRAYGLPTEARSAHAWYAYTSTVGVDYSVGVEPNLFYSQSHLKPDDLIRHQMPVEPPSFRRILISKYAESIEIKVPYRFRGDRPALLTGRLRVDGQISLPGIWQKPMEWDAQKQLSADGVELTGVATFTISLKQMLETLETTRKTLDIGVEPLELKIQPTFEVQASGLSQPVTVTNRLDHGISVRSTTIELDDPKETKMEKTLSEVVVTPAIIESFGRPFSVAQLQQVSSIAMGVLLVIAALLLLTRRKRREDEALMAKLGPHLVTASAFELPQGVALAEIDSPRELLQLHMQTERPVIQVANAYYLLDGTTCYRLLLKPGDEVLGQVRSEHKG